MKATRAVIVTKKEALMLLGIRHSSLRALEREARIAALRERKGYSAREMNRLFDVIRKHLRRGDGPPA